MLGTCTRLYAICLSHVNYAPVICSHLPPPHLRGWAGGGGPNVWGNDLLSSPAVPGKCRACDITQIYLHGINYYTEQGFDSQQVPAVQGF